MEDRHIIAYSLIAAGLLFVGIFVWRHLNNRRKFKIRQAGRGKSEASIPAE